MMLSLNVGVSLIPHHTTSGLVVEANYNANHQYETLQASILTNIKLIYFNLFVLKCK